MEEIEAQAQPPPPPPPSSRPVPAAPAANGSGMNGTGLRGKPTPPVPPAKRPAGRKPVPAPASRDSGYSGSVPSSSDASRDSVGMAGSLAEALRARQAAMNSRKKDDDW